MICTQCKTETPDGNAFCHQCGAGLAATEPAAPSKSKWYGLGGIGIGLVIALKFFGKAILFVFSHHLIPGFIVIKRFFYNEQGFTFAAIIGVLAIVALILSFHKYIVGAAMIVVGFFKRGSA